MATWITSLNHLSSINKENHYLDPESIVQCEVNTIESMVLYEELAHS